jgi:hypothetical protein
MHIVVVTDWRRHVFHPALVVRASRALADENRWEFEAILREFARNYFMEGLVKSGEGSFLGFLQKYIFLGTVTGFNRAKNLLGEIKDGKIRIIEVGDPYVPFYTAGILFLNGKPVQKEILRRLPDPAEFNDEDYLRFLLMLFEHNHRFGVVGCAFEFWAMREALYRGILRPEEPGIWKGRGCFVGIVPSSVEMDDVEGKFKMACRNGWCVLYFRGSRKKLEENLNELGLTLPSESSQLQSPPHTSSASSRRTR